MSRSAYLIPLSLLFFLLTGCGNVHNMVRPGENVAGRVQKATLKPVTITSTDTKEAVVALQEEWKQMAANEIKRVLSEKRIAEADDAATTITCNIEAQYGNRALRYLAGVFGAGKGHVAVTIEMKDAGGKTLYSGTSKADLSVGVFGGNMKAVARKAIEEAAKEFGAHL